MEKVSKRKVDMLSNFISNVVNSNKECPAFEGAYICCRKDKELDISLNVVWSDYHFKMLYSASELDKISDKLDFRFHIELIPFNFFLGQCEEYSIFFKEDRGMLRDGNIIYDQNGYLDNLQKLYKENPSVEIHNYDDIVEIKPPIQYIKK